MITIPGYARPPSYNANNISITPVGDLSSTVLQDGLEELDSDLSGGLASKLPYSYGTATPSTTDSGFLWYDSNSTPAAPKFWDGAAFQALTSGKILQVVRATDATDRATSSTSVVDASISVTITPQKSDSAVLLLWLFQAGPNSNNRMETRITDNSNNTVSGAETITSGSTNAAWRSSVLLIGYSTPATTSATTYKGRFRAVEGTVTLINSQNTGQMYALEVAA